MRGFREIGDRFREIGDRFSEIGDRFREIARGSRPISSGDSEGVQAYLVDDCSMRVRGCMQVRAWCVSE